MGLANQAHSGTMYTHASFLHLPKMRSIMLMCCVAYSVDTCGKVFSHVHKLEHISQELEQITNYITIMNDIDTDTTLKGHLYGKCLHYGTLQSTA